MLAGVESARSSRAGEGLAMQRAVQLYLTMLTLLVAGLGVIFYLGSGLSKSHLVSQAKVETQAAVDVLTKDAPLTTSVEERLLQNAADPLGRFFLQLFVVIVVSNGVGWLFTRCGQPAVVGEMMAGILLGPSLFGLLTPRAFEFVFAASSLEPLRFLSQIGVCLFMFLVGMEMDWSELRAKMSTAVLISHAGIAFPGLLGAGLALLLYDRLAQSGAPFVPFALFLAISISVTAFPVLVRILQDRRLLTSLSGLASPNDLLQLSSPLCSPQHSQHKCWASTRCLVLSWPALSCRLEAASGKNWRFGWRISVRSYSCPCFLRSRACELRSVYSMAGPIGCYVC